MCIRDRRIPIGLDARSDCDWVLWQIGRGKGEGWRWKATGPGGHRALHDVSVGRGANSPAVDDVVWHYKEVLKKIRASFLTQFQLVN